MRKRISEQNIFPNFDLYNEYYKIEKILSIDINVGLQNSFQKFPPKYTIEWYVDNSCFNNWNLRGTFTTLKEMRDALGIGYGTINPQNVTAETVLDFLQYAINCTSRATETICSSKYYLKDKTIMIVLFENIKSLAEKLKCGFDLDEEKQEIFLVYQNEIATVISKDCPDVEDSITEYLKIDTRGDTKRKAEILCTLYKKLESVETKLKANNFGNIISDTTFLFDKSGIRHWIEKDKIACETFLKMKDSEIESWYDKIFNMFLTCMVLAKYIDIIPDVKNIKRIACQ